MSHPAGGLIVSVTRAGSEFVTNRTRDLRRVIFPHIGQFLRCPERCCVANGPLDGGSHNRQIAGLRVTSRRRNAFGIASWTEDQE